MGSVEPLIVYFSAGGDTKRFVDSLGFESVRITPQNAGDLVMGQDFVLVVPSYGAGSARRAVAPQVARFLSNPINQGYCVATVGGGNSIYGQFFAYAADFIAEKLSHDTHRVVPVLYKFELFGLPADQEQCRSRILEFWDSTHEEKRGGGRVLCDTPAGDVCPLILPAGEPVVFDTGVDPQVRLQVYPAEVQGVVDKVYACDPDTVTDAAVLLLGLCQRFTGEDASLDVGLWCAVCDAVDALTWFMDTGDSSRLDTCLEELTSTL